VSPQGDRDFRIASFRRILSRGSISKMAEPIRVAHVRCHALADLQWRDGDE